MYSSSQVIEILKNLYLLGLNRNIGKFNLPHIWDKVLLITLGLTLKRHVQAVGHAKSNQPNT